MLQYRVIMGVYPTQYARDSAVTERMLSFHRARGVDEFIPGGFDIEEAEAVAVMTEIPRDELLRRLETKGVRILTSTVIQRIEPDRLVYRDEAGAERSLPLDTVVVAAGARPGPTLAEELEGKVPEVYPDGDCIRPGTGGMAIRSGLDVAMRI